MLTWGLHLCAINHFSLSLILKILFFPSSGSIVCWDLWRASAGRYSSLAFQSVERVATSRWWFQEPWDHTLSLEGTFGGHQVTAEFAVKLDQALKAFLTSESLYGSGYLSSYRKLWQQQKEPRRKRSVNEQLRVIEVNPGHSQIFTFSPSCHILSTLLAHPSKCVINP